MGILAVFLAGLVKLWWNTRLMKKQAILDEEKKARLEEMRRTGLPLKRANEIPFGIRAIQSGVQVQGIWISRPVSPTETASARNVPSVTVVNLDNEKAIEYRDNQTRAPPTTQLGQTGLSNTQTDDPNESQSVESRLPYAVAQPKRPTPHATDALNETTLRELEVESQPKPVYETYVPTSAPRKPSQRSSVSLSGESLDSQPRSARSVSGRSYASSHSSRLYTARSIQDNRTGYHTSMSHHWKEEAGDPFGTPSPARTPSGFSALSRADPGVPHQRELLSPEPTFGPGDLHVNRTTRRVNAGFEVLPAGTFGVLHEVHGTVPPEKSQKRLRKKSNSYIREEDLGRI